MHSGHVVLISSHISQTNPKIIVAELRPLEKRSDKDQKNKLLKPKVLKPKTLNPKTLNPEPRTSFCERRRHLASDEADKVAAGVQALDFGGLGFRAFGLRFFGIRI